VWRWVIPEQEMYLGEDWIVETHLGYYYHSGALVIWRNSDQCSAASTVLMPSMWMLLALEISGFGRKSFVERD
jgi:hypothetical protein